MVEFAKFHELTTSSWSSIGLKFLSLIFLSFTIIIPIVQVHYTGKELNVVEIFYAFNISLNFTQGTSTGIPTYYNTGFLTIFYILVVSLVFVTIGFLFMSKDRYATITNSSAIIVLFLIFLNYYLIDTLSGQIISGVSVSINNDIGFYLLILSLLGLFSSSFLHFELMSKSDLPL